MYRTKSNNYWIRSHSCYIGLVSYSGTLKRQGWIFNYYLLKYFWTINYLNILLYTLVYFVTNETLVLVIKYFGLSKIYYISIQLVALDWLSIMQILTSIISMESFIEELSWSGLFVKVEISGSNDRATIGLGLTYVALLFIQFS